MHILKILGTETIMKIVKKAAVAMAAMSMIASPVAASAASTVDVRALSVVEDANNEGSNVLWILLGLAAVIGLIIVVSDDSPSSP